MDYKMIKNLFYENKKVLISDKISKEKSIHSNKIFNNSIHALVYINSIDMGQFYLRRFSALGLDTYSYMGHDNFYEAIILVKYLVEKYNNKIIIVAENEHVNNAVLLASIVKPEALIIQSINEDKALENISGEINFPCLFASCGLDEKSTLEWNNSIFKDNKNVIHIHYPKYINERINDFEDEKMNFINKIVNGGKNE